MMGDSGGERKEREREGGRERERERRRERDRKGGLEGGTVEHRWG